MMSILGNLHLGIICAQNMLATRKREIGIFRDLPGTNYPFLYPRVTGFCHSVVAEDFNLNV